MMKTNSVGRPRALLLVLAACVVALVLALPAVAGAAAPVTMSDGELRQLAKLRASDAALGDALGGDVAIDGDTAFVGAASKDTASGANAGAVYVYTRTGDVWTQTQRLTAGNGQVDARFGGAVALDGDTALVGAYNYAIVGTGTGVGEVYAYTRVAGVWVQSQRFIAADAAAGDWFGYSLDLDGDTAVIGARNNFVNPVGYGPGEAYVFVRAAGVWAQQQKLVASDGASNDAFGFRVDVQGDAALVSAVYDNTAKGSDAGSVYVFHRSGTTWTETQRIEPNEGGESAWFGFSIDLDGANLLVGASNEANPGVGAGAAYLFTDTGSGWTQHQRLTAAAGLADNDHFGQSVALDDDTAVIGARSHSASNGNPGAAYQFNRAGSTWIQREKIVPADGVNGGAFGHSVELDADTALIGAVDTGTGGSAYLFATSYATDEESSVTIPMRRGVLKNDQDADGDLLTPSLVDTSALHGDLVFGAGGAFIFTPELDFAGTATATYQVFDGTEFSSPATITIKVVPVNDAPIGVADALAIDEDATLETNVLANDIDVDNALASRTATAVSAVSTGTLTASASGDITYTPPADWSGTATFTYRVSDGQYTAAPVTATITVAPVNDAPIGVEDSIGCPENGDAILDVLANDIDIDTPAGSLVATDFSAVSDGSIVTSASGEVVYTAPLDWLGTATFTYRVTDGEFTSDPVTATVLVQKAVVTRIDGLDRYVVAARTARHGWDPDLDHSWPNVDHVIIANGEYGREADPLCSSGLAGIYDAPILLTKAGSLPDATRDVLADIAAANPGVKVHIVGGPLSVPVARWEEIRRIQGVDQTLDRIGGKDRYYVSAGIASRMIAVKGVAAIPGVLIVAADTTPAFYDALASSPIAFSKTMPMLAVRKDRIQPPIDKLLTGSLAGKPRYAVSNTRYIGSVPGAGATRLVNTSNRYTASQQIAEQALKRGWLTPTEVGTASKLSDALTGGAFLGRRDGAMLYTDTDDTVVLSATQFIEAHNDRILIGWILGGHSSVTEQQEDTFWQLLE